jgi:hypothetical protein
MYPPWRVSKRIVSLLSSDGCAGALAGLAHVSVINIEQDVCASVANQRRLALRTGALLFPPLQELTEQGLALLVREVRRCWSLVLQK